MLIMGVRTHVHGSIWPSLTPLPVETLNTLDVMFSQFSSYPLHSSNERGAYLYAYPSIQLTPFCERSK